MSPAAPTTEIGRAGLNFTLPGWGEMAPAIDEREYAPDLVWPSSIGTYRRMETDAQIAGLLLGTMLPIRRFRWSIEQGEASDEVTEHIARDFNLPVTGEDAPPVIKRSEARNRFSHDRHLAHALRALVYGHYAFEQVGLIGGDERWHLKKLAPRPPYTIADGGSIETSTADGGLAGIKQGVGLQAKLIPVDRLVYYCWDQEGADWFGRSLIRACFRHWARKDRLLRVDAMRHERNGLGVPWFETTPELTQPQVDKLAATAQAWRSGDTAGGAGPGKPHLKGVDGSLSDIIASIRYDDQQMSMATLQLFADLGRSTSTGSYAQSASLIDWYGYAQEAIADWYVGITTEHAIWDDVDWNFGGDENAPKLVYDRSAEEDLPISDLALLVEKEIITPDPALEDAIRTKHNLPEREEAETEPVAEPAVPVPAPVEITTAKRRPVRATVEPREFRREPTQMESDAQVDFAAMDEGFRSEREQLVADVQAAQEEQINDLHDQIVEAGGDLTALAAIVAAPVAGSLILAAMQSMSAQGVEQAMAEGTAQGATPDAGDAEALAESMTARATATDVALAASISDAARRKALGLSGGTLAPEDVALATVEHLEGLSTAFLDEQLGGALMSAQNAGRNSVFRANTLDTIFASELLDENTCEVCAEADGTEFASMEEAEAVYSGGGNNGCLGGPRCRGTLVARFTT